MVLLGLNSPKAPGWGSGTSAPGHPIAAQGSGGNSGQISSAGGTACPGTLLPPPHRSPGSSLLTPAPRCRAFPGRPVRASGHFAADEDVWTQGAGFAAPGLTQGSAGGRSLAQKPQTEPGAGEVPPVQLPQQSRTAGLTLPGSVLSWGCIPVREASPDQVREGISPHVVAQGWGSLPQPRLGWDAHAGSWLEGLAPALEVQQTSYLGSPVTWGEGAAFLSWAWAGAGTGGHIQSDPCCKQSQCQPHPPSGAVSRQPGGRGGDASAGPLTRVKTARTHVRSLPLLPVHCAAPRRRAGRGRCGAATSGARRKCPRPGPCSAAPLRSPPPPAAAPRRWGRVCEGAGEGG